MKLLSVVVLLIVTAQNKADKDEFELVDDGVFDYYAIDAAEQCMNRKIQTRK